jgi:chitinase
MCSTLAAGQHVCCSAGTLPDYSPQPYANGSCVSYLVQAGDYCDELVAEYSLTLDELGGYNNNTWGWIGCADLQAGQYLCLSLGSPPMPAVVTNAVCGPQVPGTPIAPTGTNLSTLNECPLNACCDIWGQCGTTAEFCTISESPTRAPGTAAEGTNGCISNCGTSIIIRSAPTEVLKVGFFEGYNLDRPCINMPITSFNTSGYTDIYLAFAALTTDYEVDVSAI